MRKGAGVFLAVLFAAAAMVGGAGLVGLHYLDVNGPLVEERTLVIDRGLGVLEIGERLEQAGVVSNRWVFAAGTHWLQAKDRLKAGEYAFPAGVSLRDTVEVLRSGRTVVRTFLVPEGYTVARVAALLEAEPALTGPIGGLPPEGTLLPDSYHFSYGDTRVSLLKRMAEAGRVVLARVWSQRAEDVPLASADQALVLASIIEKETGIGAERAKVAGVFVNRLRAGMRLQSDPTVVYALTGGTAALGRALTRADWQVGSPFNTYQIPGLPPAPIANPGRAALEAAVNPERHNYFYFVADGSGGHAFAESLAEHNRNVARARQARLEQVSDRVGFGTSPEKAEPAAAAAAAPPPSLPSTPEASAPPP